MAEPKVIIFCTQVGYINSILLMELIQPTCRLYQFYQKDSISPTKGAWLRSHDCFTILPFAETHRTGSSATSELLVLREVMPIVEWYDFWIIADFECDVYHATSSCVRLSICHKLGILQRRLNLGSHKQRHIAQEV